MKLSSPWAIYYRQIQALFAQDPEIKVTLNDEGPELKIYVDNGRKADALSQLLPTEKVYGNVTLKISVIPADGKEASKLDLIQEAFFGNPALSYVWSADTPMGKVDFAVFEKKVVQYFNDDLFDINGLCSTLYQNIAKDVFGDDTGVHFCTETDDKKLIKPLGEWP